MKKITLLFTFILMVTFNYGQNIALNFDGVSPAYVSGGPMAGQTVFTTPMIPYSNTFTVMGWVNIGGESHIFTWGSSAVNGYIAIESHQNKFHFFSPLGGANISSTTIIVGGWHHIAATSDAGSIKIYVDGVLENTGTDSSSNTPTVSSMGAAIFNNGWQGKMSGDVDELSIWNVALTLSQINTFKSTPPIGTETGLMAAYNFNESGITTGGDNTGKTTLTDLAGNYPGTLFGFSLSGATGNWVNSSNTVLAIDKTKKEFGFSLYPNPTSDFVNLNYANSVRIKKLQLFNSVGSLVKEFDNNKKELNISKLSGGFYFLKIDSNKGVVNYKIIKE